MDTITHALSGALLARATAGEDDGITASQRTWLGGFAAAFPDSDYVLNWIDPLTYLNWHRGPTHSLLLLPFWALLIAILYYLASGRRLPFRSLVMLCTMCIGIHIAGDIITVYGTKIFSPFSDLRVALPTTFIIDLGFTGIIVLGLFASYSWRLRAGAAAGLVALVSYVSLEGYWYRDALLLAQTFARAHDIPETRAYALPQPLSPLNWKLIVVDGDKYRHTYVRLHGDSSPVLAIGPLKQLADNYQSRANLRWITTARFGPSSADTQLVRRIWVREELAGFRDFAVFPALFRVDRQELRECLWFTDLRFVIGNLTPPFRYGLCHQPASESWQLERLRGREDRKA